MIRSGAISRQVELWKKSVVKNDYGEYIESWSFDKKMRAYTHMQSGRQLMSNDEVFDSMRIRLSLRNQHKIIEQDRIKYLDNMYYVDHVQFSYDRRWSTIVCRRLNE